MQRPLQHTIASVVYLNVGVPVRCVLHCLQDASCPLKSHSQPCISPVSRTDGVRTCSGQFQVPTPRKHELLDAQQFYCCQYTS
jgi:hypothetical protein